MRKLRTAHGVAMCGCKESDDERAEQKPHVCGRRVLLCRGSNLARDETGPHTVNICVVVWICSDRETDVSPIRPTMCQPTSLSQKSG